VVNVWLDKAGILKYFIGNFSSSHSEAENVLSLNFLRVIDLRLGVLAITTECRKLWGRMDNCKAI
jgi:hypothetical protein